MQHFRRRQTLERFASAHSSVFNHCDKDRHLNPELSPRRFGPLLMLSGVNSVHPDCNEPGPPATGSPSPDTTIAATYSASRRWRH